MGLLRALRRYDPALGASFWAYASWWVRQAMQQLVSEMARPIVLSDRAMRQIARIWSAAAPVRPVPGPGGDLSELANLIGFSLEHVESLVSATRRPRALEEPVGGEDEVGAVLGDRIADPRGEDAYDWCRCASRVRSYRTSSRPSTSASAGSCATDSASTALPAPSASSPVPSGSAPSGCGRSSRSRCRSAVPPDVERSRAETSLPGSVVMDGVCRDPIRRACWRARVLVLRESGGSRPARVGPAVAGWGRRRGGLARVLGARYRAPSRARGPRSGARVHR